MAGKAQLKVLLWLYRNPAAKTDIKQISVDTGIPADEIDDAMLYWIEAGLIVKDGEEPEKQNAETENIPASATAVIREKAAQEKKPEERPPEIKKSTAKPIVVKPSVADIARRIEESAEVRSMFDEAQETFGRTLGYDAQSSLLILHDHYALPAEVIIMLCGYAKTIGKQGSLAYIMKIGEAWSEQGINTFDRATSKIAGMEKADKMWSEFKSLTGVENPRATAKQAEYLEIWAVDYGFTADVICYAYEKTVEKKGSISFGYMNGILRAWHEKGLKTTDDIERSEREFAAEKEKSGKKNTDGKKESGKNSGYTPPSFDIELALKRSLELDPTKTKKGQ